MKMLRHFTLVEMLTVIFILMILMAFSVSGISKIKRNAIQASCVSNLRQVGEAWNMYAQHNRGRFPYLKDNDVTNLPDYKEPSNEGGDGVRDDSPGIWESSDESYGARGRALEVLLSPYLNTEGGWSDIWLCKGAKPYRKVCIDQDRPSPWTTRYSNAPSWKYRDCGSYDGLSVLYWMNTNAKKVNECLNVSYSSAPHRAPIQWCATIRNTMLLKPQYLWDNGPALQTKTPIPTEPEFFTTKTDGVADKKQNAVSRYSTSSWHGYDDQLAMGPRPTVFLDGHVAILKNFGYRAHGYDENAVPWNNGVYEPGAERGGIPWGDVPPGLSLGINSGNRVNIYSNYTWNGAFTHAENDGRNPDFFGTINEWKDKRANRGENILDEY